MPAELALVTGASGGIGRAVVIALAGKNLEMIITGRKEVQLKKVSAAVKKQGKHCDYIAADLSNPDQLATLIGFLRKKKKTLSLLVHNTGVARVGSCARLTADSWQESLQVNLTIPFILTQKCLPLMRPGGQIIFINSVAGKNAFPDWSAYCAAKAGLKAYADVLRLELQDRGIRVTSIFPSSVDTSMHNSLPYNWDRKKMLKTQDVARAVLYCYQQPAGVVIKEIDLESSAGVF
jgi:NADP-dependent 3-hydroxy acid dehydrogenase YdfG